MVRSAADVGAVGVSKRLLPWVRPDEEFPEVVEIPIAQRVIPVAEFACHDATPVMSQSPAVSDIEVMSFQTPEAAPDVSALTDEEAYSPTFPDVASAVPFDPAIPPEAVMALEKVFTPANVWTPVVMTPGTDPVAATILSPPIAADEETSASTIDAAENVPPATFTTPVDAAMFKPVPPYWLGIGVPAQDPMDIVPREVMSELTSFEDGINPASIVFVTFPDPIAVTPDELSVTSPLTVAGSASPVPLPI
jgi:hypothetical protein